MLDTIEFRYRAGGIALRDDHILLQWSAPFHFWFLPGGAVERGEDSANALRREITEETGAEVEVGPVLYVAEGLYARNGRKRHEIEIARRIYVPDSSPLVSSTPLVSREDPEEYFAWYALENLNTLPLKPPDLATLDLNGASVTHIHFELSCDDFA